MSVGDVEAFYRKHCAAPGGVIIAQRDDGVIGVFSCVEHVQAWSARSVHACVIAPYIIDEPDYGNAPQH